MSRLDEVLAQIDAANAADPSRALDGDVERPAALIYGRRMSSQLADFVAAPSEVLQIAARGQHIERWTVPRSEYPEGREGYLTWRRDQGRRHGERLAAIMAAEGYGEAEQARVGVLLRKEGIKRDPEVQALEDVICLVFLRHYALEFAAKHSTDAVERILAKTARKMSPEGRAAVAGLGLPEPVAATFSA